eukprot:s2805_g19.t1
MESASSDAKKKDLEQIRSALEENSSVVNELMAAHSRTTTLVQELNSEVKDTKWQLQEMQEADERGRASINEKLKLGIPRERRQDKRRLTEEEKEETKEKKEKQKQDQEEEFSDKGLFELLEEEEDYETYLANERAPHPELHKKEEGKKENKSTGEASAGLIEEEKRKLEEATEKEKEERKKKIKEIN